MSYVRKLGASALVIAAAFAVAFAVLLSSAEAVIQEKDATGAFQTIATPAGAENGDTVYVKHENTNGFTTFTITTIGAASASFTHSSASNDGQSITCGAAIAATAEGACDVDADDTGVTVALKIDDDSGAGTIFVNQKGITGQSTEATESIGVTVAQVATTLTAKAATSSIDAKGATADPPTAGTTYVDIRLTDANNKGIALEAITIVSTRALLTTVEDTDLNMRTLSVGSNDEPVMLTTFTGASLAGSVTTTEDAGLDTPAGRAVDSSGYARVIVTGGGSPGVSTITVTVGDLTTTTDIVLHGAVKTISAELEEGAIEVGGMTRIVVTALDAGDNPVANQNISVKTKGGVTPPEKLAKPVATKGDVNKDGGTAGSLTDKGDLPSCDDHGPTPAVEASPDEDAVDAVAASSGTNDDGQCVIQVSAPGGGTTTTTDDAARGTHTIIVVAGTGAGTKGVNEAELEIQVGGAPATIESDAPERIDPSAELTINVTVLDDESVRVGRVNIEVIHTAGDGAVITDIADRTKDGLAKFTYLAPSTPGVTEFLVRTKNTAGTVVTSQLPIIVQIAEAMPDVVEPEVVEPEVVEPVEPEVVEPEEPEVVEPEEPEVMVDPTLNPAAAGSVTLAVFSGGSVEQLKAALSECGSDVAAHATGDDGWVSYVPAAVIPAANAPFNAAFADGIPAGQILQITSCN